MTPNTGSTVCRRSLYVARRAIVTPQYRATSIGYRADRRATDVPNNIDFKAIPSLNKMLVLDLARGDYIERRENAILLGPSGVGKTHIALLWASPPARRASACASPPPPRWSTR